MKKILLFFATFIFTAILCVVTAGAEQSGDYAYSVLSDGTVEIIAYFGVDEVVEIPSKIDGKVVTSLGREKSEYGDIWILFRYGSDIKGVIIPSSVTNINAEAFSSSNLSSITVSTGNKNYCSVDGVLFNKDKTELVYYPQKKTGTSYTIPKSVTSIGEAAISTGFANNNYLTSINVASGNTRYTSVDGVLFNKNKTKLVCYPREKSTAKYSIPKGVTSIGDYAFSGCTNLVTVTIPDGVTSIGASAFNTCTSLASVTMPESITSIGEKAFRRCDITSVTIPKGVTRLQSDVFALCLSLTEITIPNNVTSIDERAFGDLYEPDFFYGMIHTDNVTIICKKDSAAHKFAVNHGFKYKFTQSPSPMSGFKFGGRASNAIRLNWTKNTSADGYIIEQYKDGKWVRVAKITNNATTTYKISGLKPSTTYKFRMKAYNMVGSVGYHGGYTGTVSATTSPSPVSGFKFGGRASNAIRLNWTKNTSADGYIIEQYKDGQWVRVAKITNNATTTYKISGLKPSTTYKFRMKAYNMVGSTGLHGGYTSTVSATTSPSAISGFKVGGKTSSAIRLNWTKNTSADGYIIEQYNDGKWVRVAKITNNATTTYKISGLKSATTYKFRVKAYNMVGKTGLYGGYTGTLAVKTK